MSKTNKIYKIFMTTMIVAIAGMLLAMGIIAAQKTMKLGVQFSSNPSYKLEVFINNEQTLIFRNFADTSGKTVKMDNGITSLNGDTLVADEEAFKGYGNDFTIIIKNYTESTGIEVSMESTAKIDGGADGIPAQIEAIKDKAIKYDPDTEIADSVSFRIYINSVFPQTTTLKITISELPDVSITYATTNNCSLSSSPETAAIGSTYETTITAETGYIFDETSVTVAGNSYTWEVDTNDKTKGTLTIANVQSDFTINANARLPKVKVTYEGDFIDKSLTTYGATIELILGDDIQQGAEQNYHYINSLFNYIDLWGWGGEGHIPEDSNLQANVLSGEYVCLYSEFRTSNNYGAVFELELSNQDLDINLLVIQNWDYRDYPNYIYFKMPSKDIDLTVNTDLFYVNLSDI